MAIAIDPQAIGWRDDGSRGGLIQTAIEQSGLVIIPLNDLNVTAINQGGLGSGASANRVSGSLGYRCGYGGVSCAVSSVDNAFFTFSFCVSGRVVGLWANPATQRSWDGVSVLIDGEAYPMPAYPSYWYATGASTTVGQQPWVVAKDLADTVHLVEVVGVGSAAIGPKAYAFGGFLAESRVYGDAQVLVFSQVCGSKLIDTTAEISLATSGYINYGTMLAICELVFYNSGTADHAVSIGSATGVITETLVVPAGLSVVRSYSPPLVRSLGGVFLKASAANVIRVTTTGIY